MAVSWLFFRKDPMAQIGVAFSNAGFMGFPLVTAVLGGEAVFYAAGFVALLNALQWTYGQAKLSGDKKYIQLGAVLKNPLVLSLLGGVVLYFCRIPVPQFLRTPMGAIAGMNAPLAMIVLGVYLARTDLKAIFTRPRLYALSAVRLVVIPLLTIACLMLLPAGWRQIGTVLIIVNAAPIGSNIAVYAQRLGLDSSYAVQMVCLSTLLSLITLPVMLSLAAALGFA
jgi:putative permease